MKRIFVLVATVLSLCASALNVYAEGEDRQWGVKAAFDIVIPGEWKGGTDLVDWHMYRNGIGGSLGAVYIYGFGSGFFLEPGASIFYDTYSYKNLVIGEGLQSDPSLYKLGVRVPVVVGYSYSLLDVLPMRVYTGPEASYAFAGAVRFKDNSLTADSGLDLFGKNGNQRRFDLAWKIGVGFEMEIATVSVEAALGITDLLKGPLSFRENRVTISATHYF